MNIHELQNLLEVTPSQRSEGGLGLGGGGGGGLQEDLLYSSSVWNSVPLHKYTDLPHGGDGIL